MLSILINAYACSPHMGSEPGMAWNWCINLAKHCELHIITEGEFRNKIEVELSNLPQGKNMHFYYNPISDKVRKMCWNQGDWRFYYHYDKWQERTLEIAKEIILRQHIDIIHQLNMIGFREPGYLWKVKDIPFIWGPVNAKEKIPTAYLEGANWKKKIFIQTKNTLNKIQLTTASKVRKAINKAEYVIAASSDSAQTLKKYFQCDAILINESGCDVSDTPFKFPKHEHSSFNILWVGRFIFTKQLTLALQTIAQTNNPNIRLHIVGGTTEEEIAYKEVAKDMGIETQCIWHSKVSQKDVYELMQSSDLFFFTSIAEGTPHVVLEAFGNKLPVLCFDTCGHGDSVDNSVGIKIELSTPKQSVREFAEKIDFLYRNPDMLKWMSNNCILRQQELSWERKASKMIELYNEITKK